jgi:hypothetical protein
MLIKTDSKWGQPPGNHLRVHKTVIRKRWLRGGGARCSAEPPSAPFILALHMVLPHWPLMAVMEGRWR